MTRSVSESVIDEVRSRTDIVPLVSEDVVLKKRGRNYVGLCPFHSEKTPSFTVSPDKQIFYCFGCGTGGDAFSYIMKRRGTSFMEALKMLAQRCSVTLPDDVQSEEEKSRYREREMVFEINKIALEYFTGLYNTSPAGRQAAAYLESRGIEKSTIQAFGIGVAGADWDGLLQSLTRKGIGVEDLATAGLVIQRQGGSGYYDRFRNRVIFPILDMGGRVTGFGGRVLDDSQPKYLNSPETPAFDKSRNIYGIHLTRQAMREKDQVILVEGYMDVIGVYQAGVRHVGATLGTALSESHGRILSQFGTDIVVAYDGDTAGQTAALRGAGLLEKAGCSVRIARLPADEDPDSFIRKHGSEAFMEIVERAQSVTGFQLQDILEKNRNNTPDAQAEAIRRAIPVIAAVQAVSERDVYIRNLARTLGVREDSLRTDVQRYLRRGKSPGPAVPATRPQEQSSASQQSLLPAHEKAEQALLRLIPEDPDTWITVKDSLQPELFSNEGLRRIARACYDLDASGSRLTISRLLDYIQEHDPQVYAEAARLYIDETDVHRLKTAVHDYIKVIKDYQRKEELRRVAEEIREWESKGDRQKADELLARYQNLLRGAKGGQS
jgi:DNA primase